jgi:hypothetical protein
MALAGLAERRAELREWCGAPERLSAVRCLLTARTGLTADS